VAATNTTLTGSQFASGAITLTASTVDTVTFPSHVPEVEVVNMNGAGALYFTVDGSTPTVGGLSTRVLPAAVGSRTVRVKVTGDATVVKLISSAAVQYVVETP
jgi:hypothetical protein